MARKMVLMKKDLLLNIYSQYKQGVPLLLLIRKYKLSDEIAPPTLTKLISYLEIRETAGEQESQIVGASLFPAWLAEAETNLPKTRVFKTAPTSCYIGKMPFGRWIEDNQQV